MISHVSTVCFTAHSVYKLEADLQFLVAAAEAQAAAKAKAAVEAKTALKTKSASATIYVSVHCMVLQVQSV